MSIKIKANRQLFDDIKELEHDIQFLAGIVQNDQEISSSRLGEFNSQMKEFKYKITNWNKKVQKHILDCNN